MSWPASSTRPESGRKAPVTRLKNVVLPAPLGPITAVSEPSSKFRLTPFMALTPPKDLRRFSMLSMSGFFSGRHASSGRLPRRSSPCPYIDDKAEQAFAQAEREEKDDDAQYQAVVLGEPGHHVVEQQQDTRAGKRPEEDIHSAKQDHEHGFTRNRPVCEIRIRAGYEQAHEDAADAAEEAGHHERQQADAPYLDAEVTGAARIVPDHAQRVAER